MRLCSTDVCIHRSYYKHHYFYASRWGMRSEHYGIRRSRSKRQTHRRQSELKSMKRDSLGAIAPSPEAWYPQTDAKKNVLWRNVAAFIVFELEFPKCTRHNHYWRRSKEMMTNHKSLKNLVNPSRRFVDSLWSAKPTRITWMGAWILKLPCFTIFQLSYFSLFQLLFKLRS